MNTMAILEEECARLREENAKLREEVAYYLAQYNELYEAHLRNTASINEAVARAEREAALDARDRQTRAANSYLGDENWSEE